MVSSNPDAPQATARTPVAEKLPLTAPSRELPERERTILMLRFFGNLTQTQIAEKIGISQMHVSRLLARTLEQLRSGMVPNE